MGCFSWMFADEENEKALKIGRSAFLACPDGSFIYEPCYEGYGMFNRHDAYELVAEWNRDALDISMLRKPSRKAYEGYPQADEWFEGAARAYGRSAERLTDFRDGRKTSDEMKRAYGDDWKRDIGTDIACGDEQNAALPFPIKVARFDFVPYDGLPSSLGDEFGGCGCDDEW